MPLVKSKIIHSYYKKALEESALRKILAFCVMMRPRSWVASFLLVSGFSGSVKDDLYPSMAATRYGSTG